jgi:hypothetical protein
VRVPRAVIRIASGNSPPTAVGQFRSLTLLLRMGNKVSERHVYDYVDACVRDEPRDASAMHRQFSIFGNSAVNASLDILRGISCELPQEE